MSVQKRTTETEVQQRNQGAMSLLSEIACIQEIGAEVSVSIKGETRIRVTRDGIWYELQSNPSYRRDTTYPIRIQGIGAQRTNARTSVEDALHDLYECIVHDPRQTGIELRGIRYTDTR